MAAAELCGAPELVAALLSALDVVTALVVPELGAETVGANGIVVPVDSIGVGALTIMDVVVGTVGVDSPAVDVAIGAVVLRGMLTGLVVVGVTVLRKANLADNGHAYPGGNIEGVPAWATTPSEFPITTARTTETTVVNFMVSKVKDNKHVHTVRNT